MKKQRKNWFTWLTVLVTLAPFLESFYQGVEVIASEKEKEVQLYDVDQVGSSKLSYQVKDDEIQWDLEVTKNQEDTKNVFTFTAEKKALPIKKIIADEKNAPSTFKDNVLSEGTPIWSTGSQHVTFTTAWAKEVKVQSSLLTSTNGVTTDILQESQPVTITLPEVKVTTAATTSKEVTNSTTSTLTKSTVEKTAATEEKPTTGTSETQEERLSSPPTKSLKANEATGRDITTLPGASQLPDSDEGKTIFTSVELLKDGQPLQENEALNPNDKISLEYAWQLPEVLAKEMVAGDTFTFDLPERLHLVDMTSLTGNLSDTNGKVFGTYSVAEKGTSGVYQVTIVFKDEVNKSNKIHGTFHIGGTVRELDTDTPGTNTSTIPFVDNNNKTSFPVESTKKNDISKQVEDVINPEKGSQFGYVNWAITINSSFYPLKGATVREQLPAGVTFEDLTSVERISKDGTPVKPDDVVTNEENLQQPIFTIPDSSDKYILHLKTKVDFSVSPYNNTPNSSITNNAFLDTENNGEIPTNATANFGFDGKVTKVADSEDPTADIKKGILPWKISYTGDPLPAGTTFVETLSSGQTFSDENGKEVTDLDQYFSEKSGQTVKVTKSGDTYTLAFPNGISGDFDIKYFTKTNVAFDGSSNVTYSNKVDWQDNHDNPHFDYHKHTLTKSAGSYDPKTETASWKIHFEQGTDPLAPGATLIDTMDKGQKLLDGKTGTELKTGDIFHADPEIKIGKVTEDGDKTNYELIFTNGTSKDFDFEYFTKAANKPDETYTNKLEGEGANEGTGIGVPITTGKPDFNKSKAQKPSLNPETLVGHTSWTLTANTQHSSIDGWFFEDTLSQKGFTDATKTHHYFSEDDINKLKVTETTIDGKTKEVSKDDYTIEEKTASDGKIIGFKLYSKNVTLDSEGKMTNSGDYKTTSSYKVDYSSTYEAESKNYNSSVGNTADFTYFVGNNPSEKTSNNKEFNPQPKEWSNTGGSKGGTYDRATNKITWTVKVNVKNKNQIGEDGKLTDTLPTSVTYNKDLVIKKDGNEVYPAEDSNFKETLTGNVLVITGFEPGDANYELTYTTTPKDLVHIPTGSVTNTASYEDTHTTATNWPATVDYTNVTNYLSKLGTETGKKNTFHYTLEVNKDSLKLKNVVVEDTAQVLNANGEKSGSVNLIESSLKVYEVDKDGKPVAVDKDGNPVLADPANYVASFQAKEPQLTVYLSDAPINKDSEIVDVTKLGDFSKHYKIEYDGQARLEGYSNEGLTVTNGAKITGENIQEGLPGGSSNIPVQVDTAGGDASGTKGSLTITKTNQAGELLPGAHFKLSQVTPTDTVIAQNEEAKDGTLIFTDLDRGTYKLEEILAPDGYVLSDKEYTFEIGQEDADGNEIWDINATNDPDTKIVNIPSGSLKLIKTAADGKTGLDGAIFALTNEAGKPVTLDASGKKLPATYTTKDGGMIVVNNLVPGNYKWQEITAPSGYAFDQKNPITEVTVNSGETAKSTVKNTELIDISGTKTWELAGNTEDKFLPEKITLVLHQNPAGDKDGKIAEVTQASDWNYTFKDLPKYYFNDKNEAVAYNYTVSEEAITGFTAKIDGYNITNTLDTTEINVTKTWDDQENFYGTRPDNLKVTLMVKDEDSWKSFEEAFGVEKTVTLNQDNKWTTNFDKLPIYDVTGNKIVYGVQEESTNTTYTAVTENGLALVENQNAKLENKLETTQITVEKNWQDYNNQFASRPEKITFKLYAKTEKGTKQLVKTPEMPEGEFTITGPDFKASTIDGLPVYDKNGDKLIYSVEETNIQENYQKDPEYSTEDNNLSITNILVETDLTGEKTWSDYNNLFFSRPESIKVQLLQNGKEMKGYLQEVTAKDNWQYTFNHLPKVDQDGKAYEYTVKEVSVPANYTVKEDGMKITNFLVETKVTGEKTWSDHNNLFSSRPESIQVQLLQNGQEMKGYLQEVTAKDNWKYTFNHLPKVDKDGTAYEYSVKEVSVPKNYTAKEDGMKITNTLVETKVTGEKTWSDYNNLFSSRPESIKVQLLQNGQEMKGYLQTVSAKDNWKYTFNDLPKVDKDGVAYTYTIKEVAVPKNYTAKEDGMKVTNVLLETNISGEKTWSDFGNVYQSRPESIKVQLLQNGEKMTGYLQEVSAKDNWKYTFNHLPEFDKDGKAYEYTVQEVSAPKNYTAKEEGTNITNTLKTTELSGDKIWKDNNNLFGLRSEKLTFQLYQNDVAMVGKMVEVSQANNWHYQFKDLPEVDKEGTPYVYTVKEIAAPKGYEATETANLKTKEFDITNTLQTVEIKGKKTWQDQNDLFASRPAELWIQLYQNGQKLTGYQQAVTAKTNWAYSFGNLPQMDTEGNLYEYSVKEIDPPKNYQQETQDPEALLDLTNTLIETKVEGQKTWEDFDNEYASRPEGIKVQLYQNGEKMLGYMQEVTAKQKWHFGFEHLPKFDKAGKAYAYTVKEVSAPKNYQATENGMNLTNTLFTTNVAGEKIWKDNNDQAKLRPAAITVILLQNGKTFKEVQVSGDTNWHYVFKDLPKFDTTGKAYVYTVKEKDVPKGYTSSVKDWNITNTYTPPVPPEKPHGRLPQTGEAHQQMTTLTGLSMMLLSAITLVGAFRKRKD